VVLSILLRYDGLNILLVTKNLLIPIDKNELGEELSELELQFGIKWLILCHKSEIAAVQYFNQLNTNRKDSGRILKVLVDEEKSKELKPHARVLEQYIEIYN